MNKQEQLHGRCACESASEQVYIVMPQHLNSFGKLFGGQLAAWIDVIAGVAATRHCRMPITTAAIDNLRFRESVSQNDLLVLRARVTYTGRTSIEVRVDSFVENILTSEMKLVNTAFVIEVAMDENNKPRPVPPIIPCSEEEKADFEAGEKRRRMRQSKYALFE
ncbi:MAG: acyl-CoA thioesterase [Planctomycetota bacterium]|jgi:acyl-CoA hydrolase|nr:acyl-CoA thioesterase [Planctomycetota bacterium]